MYGIDPGLAQGQGSTQSEHRRPARQLDTDTVPWHTQTGKDISGHLPYHPRATPPGVANAEQQRGPPCASFTRP